MNALKATTNHPDNGERMRNLLRGRERCRRSRKTRFQHVQEGVDVRMVQGTDLR